MEHTKSLGNQMSKPVKCIYYAVTLFGNAIWNKIPSRHLRKWFYQLLGAKMGKNTFLCRRVEILLPQGLKLGDGVAVGWFAELDARGGITVLDRNGCYDFARRKYRQWGCCSSRGGCYKGYSSL